MPDPAARLRRLPADTLTALAFFSRLPVRAQGLDLRRAAAAWPIAGLLLALGPALLFLILPATGFPPMIAAILALALYAALTGAMHEDGLADTFDGLGGGRTAEAKLTIMRDSRIGTFGVLALVFTIALKIAGLSSLGIVAWQGALALIGAAVFSRALALWHWNATLPARRDGMAWATGQPDGLAAAFGLAAGVIAALILLFAFGFAALVGILAAAAAIGVFSKLASRQIGGHTGDTIGAAQQIAEALLFAGLALGRTTNLL